MPEVGNTPKKGQVLSWAESSAVVFANSVIGASQTEIQELLNSSLPQTGHFLEFKEN